MVLIVSFLVFNHLAEEESVGCFTLTDAWCFVTVSVLWLFLTVTLVDLLCFCGVTHFQHIEIIFW